MAIYKITMGDGSQENVTLGMGALAELSRRQPEIYQRYRSLYKILGTGQDVDELVMAELIYIGYRTANSSSEDCMDKETFFEAMTDSREEIGKVFMQLFGVQEKKQASAMPSARPRGKKRGRR